MSEVFFVIGGGIFVLLGLLHAIYTFRDIHDSRRLVPDDSSVRAAMERSGLRLSRGGTTIWRAWVGFNFSHSLGVLYFGGSCLVLAILSRTLQVPRPLFGVPVVVGTIYLWLAQRYWFRAPLIAVGTATAMMALGWLTY